jgi:hypothetical protein
MDEASKQPAATPPGQPGQPQQFAVDVSALSTVYANFCRVTGTPEELVLDFGLNTAMAPVANEPVKLSHRLVLNYFTAKRLLGALHMAVQQHENAYGVLETDIQKRARSGGRPGGQPAMPRPGGAPGMG